MSEWMFKIGETVAIKASREWGEVIGRAEYAQTEPHYLIRYRAADGRAVEAWWGESSLVTEDSLEASAPGEA